MHLLIRAGKEIWEDRDADISKNLLVFNEDHRPPEQISFGNFENSLNVIFGLVYDDAGWDILNNPYVEFRGHQISNGMKITNLLDLHICPDEEKARFVPEKAIGWYPQALCIYNRDDAVIKKNWFMDDYSTPMIAISYCKNTTQNSNWCKPKDEIDDFLAEMPAFFVHMVTYVQEDMWHDHAEVEKFPHNNDTENYFPTVSTYSAIK